MGNCRHKLKNAHSGIIAYESFVTVIIKCISIKGKKKVLMLGNCRVSDPGKKVFSFEDMSVIETAQLLYTIKISKSYSSGEGSVDLHLMWCLKKRD